jgi:FkbM family methyltransferase
MNATKHCRYGDMTYRVNDLYIGRSFDLYGEFSEGEVEVFRQLVRPGQTVLDVGANIGAHTVPLAKLVGRSGRVLAFEPQRTVYYALCGNVAQNNLDQVHCFHAAVGERAGTIAVPEIDSDAEFNFGGLALSAAPASAASATVSVLRIDDLKLTACDLIKVDVEGMEREVLAGASETIRRFHPLLYVEDDRREKSAALHALLKSLGYEFYAHRPWLFNADNFLGNALNVFPNIVSHNLYAYHVNKASPIRPEAFGMQPVTDGATAAPASAVGGQAARPVAQGPVGEVPAQARALLNTGLAFYEQERLDEALAAFRQALEIKPDFAEAHNNFGLVRAAQNHLDEAVVAYRRSLALKPTFAEAHNNLGLALRLLGQKDAALACCREAARLLPELPQAQNNLGNALQEAGCYEEAMESLNAALRLDANYAQAHNNLGICLWRLGRYEEAAASYRRAIELEPDMAEGHNNLASVLRDQGKLEEALACYRRASEIDPDYGAPRWNQSLIWLLQEDFARGLPEYEWRWTLDTFHRRVCPQPVWDGSPLEGKTILLTAEQGLGDAIQFIRYAPLVRERAARVVVEVHRPLRRLVKTCAGIDKIIVPGETSPPFDTYVTLMSLPWLFGTTLENIPADVPYLAADPALVEKWRQEITSMPGFRIGIAWKGSPQNAMDRERSLPLRLFEPLALLPGVTLISLQKGTGNQQIAEVADRFSVVDFGSRLDDMTGPFMDTAAVMKHLDLVITCDSALAHLAGALGVPVWVALMFTPDWRWMLARTDSPWYPTMRLFRQQRPGDWENVFREMAMALADQLSTGPSEKSAGH